METQKQKNTKMIGFVPTEKEYEQIQYISKRLNLTYTIIIRNLINRDWTLNELYEKAKKTEEYQEEGCWNVTRMILDGLIFLY